MSREYEELLAEYLEHPDRDALAERLAALLKSDPQLQQRFRQDFRLHVLLSDVSREVSSAADAPAAPACRQSLAAGRPGGSSARQHVGRFRWLALAAGLALAVAGGWWFYPRLAGTPTLGLRLVAMQGAVAVTRAGQSLAAVPGMVLQAGDHVAVKTGGQAALTYDGEPTRVELQAAAATFRAENGAKRVRLDSGLLRCTAAPQRQPFRIETPHAVAEVIGTRFWLVADTALTTLAVQEGKVALRRHDQHLEVAAGETATADAAGIEKLSPGQAWFMELLAHAAVGPWDAVDFGQCNTRDRTANCFSDNVPGADRRVWQTAARGTGVVLFDRPALKRGVLIGWVMLLPPGELPPELAPPASATRIPVVEPELPHPLTDKQPRAGICFYRGDRRRPAANLKLFPAFNLPADQGERSVWQRFMVYLDLEAPGGPIVISAVRSAAVGGWGANLTRMTEDGKPLPSLDLGIAVLAHETAVLWRGLKFVPLGPDLPPPPATDTPGNWPLRPEPGGR